MSVSLRVSHFVPCTEAEGPYRRFALWLQGCHLRCPGCCNPELFSPLSGELWSTSQLVNEIYKSHKQVAIEGITILGGEPCEQIDGLNALCSEVVKLGLGVVVFSGYTVEEARQLAGFSQLFATIDTLIDGRYEAKNPEPANGRRWIGSANQRIIHRSRRYAHSELWEGKNHAEIHITADGEMSVHGFPFEVRQLLRTLQKSK